MDFLTREQEQALAIRWRKNRDEAAMATIVLSHEPLVRKAAARFGKHGAPIEDLIQEGNLGLMRAIEKFEPERGLRFSTMAIFWVRASMQEYAHRNSSDVRPPYTHAGKRDFFRGVYRNMTVSMDRAVFEDGETLVDRFVSPDPGPDQIAEESIDSDRLRAWLDQALARLTDRERLIITARHRSESGCTLDDLAAQLGISKERVRQIESVAIARIRKWFGVPA